MDKLPLEMLSMISDYWLQQLLFERQDLSFTRWKSSSAHFIESGWHSNCPYSPIWPYIRDNWMLVNRRFREAIISCHAFKGIKDRLEKLRRVNAVVHLNLDYTAAREWWTVKIKRGSINKNDVPDAIHRVLRLPQNCCIQCVDAGNLNAREAVDLAVLIEDDGDSNFKSWSEMIRFLPDSDPNEILQHLRRLFYTANEMDVTECASCGYVELLLCTNNDRQGNLMQCVNCNDSRFFCGQCKMGGREIVGYPCPDCGCANRKSVEKSRS